MSGQWWRYPSGLVRSRPLPGYENDVVPVVVIDPEDREQAGRLLDIYTECVHSPIRGEDEPDDWRTDRMQAALREFADPKPPKPAEPTGLGAVVEDADGMKWILVYDHAMWQNHHYRAIWRHYSELGVVRVLSEGVPS